MPHSSIGPWSCILGILHVLLAENTRFVNNPFVQSFREFFCLCPALVCRYIENESGAVPLKALLFVGCARKSSTRLVICAYDLVISGLLVRIFV